MEPPEEEARAPLSRGWRRSRLLYRHPRQMKQLNAKPTKQTMQQIEGKAKAAHTRTRTLPGTPSSLHLAPLASVTPKAAGLAPASPAGLPLPRLLHGGGLGSLYFFSFVLSSYVIIEARAFNVIIAANSHRPLCGSRPGRQPTDR